MLSDTLQLHLSTNIKVSDSKSLDSNFVHVCKGWPIFSLLSINRKGMYEVGNGRPCMGVYSHGLSKIFCPVLMSHMIRFRCDIALRIIFILNLNARERKRERGAHRQRRLKKNQAKADIGSSI